MQMVFQSLTTAGKFHGVYVCSPAGSRTVNTDPLPGSLVTVTSPPIIRASLRVMARPRPVPPKRCAVVASAWLNSSNSFACCSGVMPMPVSETANSTKLLPLLTLRAASLTSPALGELAGIAEEIELYLPQPHGVYGQCAEVLLGVNDEAVLVLLGKLSGVAVFLLNFVEQPHVLDGNHRLVGEDGQEFNLLVCERPHRRA
jgi:hypothetical protein